MNKISICYRLSDWECQSGKLTLTMMMMQTQPARVVAPPPSQQQQHTTQQLLMQLQQQQQPQSMTPLFSRPATFASSAASMPPMFQTQPSSYPTASPAPVMDNNPYMKYQSFRPSSYRPTTLETVVAQSTEVNPFEHSSRKGNTSLSHSKEGDEILATSYALIPPTANAVIEYPPIFEPDNRVYREDSPECVRTDDPTKWGYMDNETDPAKPVFRQFNLVPGEKKAVPWYEHISPGYEQKKNKATGQMESTKVYDGCKWICKSPSPIRLPTAFRYTTLRFELTPHYYQTMQAFCDQLKPGKIELTIPDHAMQQYFAADHNYTKKSIIVDRIWIVEQHSTFPEPLEVQMMSTHYKSGAEERHLPVAWFQSSGPSRGTQSCPHVIYPETHHLFPPIPVYSIPPTSELEEFNRWISVDERALRKLKDGSTYGAHHYKVRGMAAKEIHCENMLQYLVTTEWSPRINAEAATATSMDIQHHHAQIQKGEDGDPAYMVVHKTILDKLVDEKFTGNMDKSMYLLRVDQSITLEIRLKNHTGQNTQFLNEVVAMHPNQHVSLSFAVVVAWDTYEGPDY